MIRVILLLLMLSIPVFAIQENSEIDRLIAQAWEYYEKGRYLKMKELSQTILEKSKEAGYPKGIAEGYYYLGVAYYSIGDRAKALEYANRALEFTDRYKNYRWRTYAITLAGEILRSLRRYDEALSQFKKALEVIKENNNKKMLPAGYVNVANIYYEMGDFKKALQYYRKGYDSARNIELRKSYLALTAYNLGLINYRMKKCPKAVKYLEEAHRIYSEIGDTTSTAQSAYYMAKGLYRQGKKNEALTVLQTNIEIARKAGLWKQYRRLIKKIKN
ncbi:tetratricopeptide repeat protein [Persephonella sp.]